MRVERKNITKNLPKKGFVKVEGKHHIYFHFHHNGIDTGAYTYVSHSKKIADYQGRLLTEVRKQLELDTNSEVVDLINCPMDEEKYTEILRQKNLIPEDPDK